MDESSTAAVSSLMADLSLNPAALELPSRTVTPSSKPARNPQRSRRRRQPFRFFDLPTELRILILEFTLFHPATIDLDPLNTYLIAPLIRIFLVSRRMHIEASQVFYSINTFRLFPIHGRFFHTKQPLLARLPARYLALITTLELRLGPGWTGPPSGWKIANPKLRLAQLEAARSFRVFVEFDPASHEVFRGFRKSEDFYTEFCRDLLVGLFAQVGGIEEVHFDAYTSVRQNSPLMTALLDEARRVGKRLVYDQARGWGQLPVLGHVPVADDSTTVAGSPASGMAVPIIMMPAAATA